MRAEDFHISDPELIQAADGELSRRRAARIRRHLAACWACRSRMAELNRTMADFTGAYTREANAVLPPTDGARALFRARLTRFAANPEQVSWRRRFRLAFVHRPGYALGALAMVVALSFAARFAVPGLRAASTPDARLTPGAVRVVTPDDICSINDEDFHPVHPSLADAVFQSYGIRNPEPRAYEVDYLITPALGGADDVRNLWPQPYSVGRWNSRVTDALEDHLHRLVCEGTLDLATAQNDLSIDWIAAYRKHFGVSRPLPRHTGFVKDPPWE